MKVAILSESPADEAAVRIFVEGLLGAKTEQPDSLPMLRTRGWTKLADNLAAVLRYLHFCVAADALVVVVDSDLTAVHVPVNCEPQRSGQECQCRMCDLAAVVQKTQRELSPRPGIPSIKTALGLAVPQIEAWCRVSDDPHVSEATWNNAPDNERFSYKSKLKPKMYGTDRPSQDIETERLRAAAEQIVKDDKLSLLERKFPGGFGALAADVRRWRDQVDK